MIAGLARADFPLLERRINDRPLVYLDSAATSLCPEPVLLAQSQYARTIGANVRRGSHALAEEANVAYAAARETVARFINADPGCVVFVRGATEALNLVASGLGLARDDEVLVPTTEHHSNLVPWLRAARVTPLPCDPASPLDVDQVERALGARRPRVFAFCHASNVTGVVHPVRDLCRVAREREVLTVVDVSQAVPHLPVDVEALGCDFLAFSGHKMLAPFGIGVLWGRRERLAALAPLAVGGGAVEEVTDSEFTLAGLPERLEPGTPNISGAIGLAAAVNYLDRLGWPAIEGHREGLAQLLHDQLSEVAGLRWVMASRPPRLPLASFAPAAGVLGPNELATMLSLSHNVMVRSGSLCAQPVLARLGLERGTVRASAYLYNSAEEIVTLARAVGDVVKRFSRG